PDAKITKMKDGRTHLAHKAEHAIDLDSGAMVAVTLQGANVGDTTSLVETASAAAEQVEAAHGERAAPAASPSKPQPASELRGLSWGNRPHFGADQPRRSAPAPRR